MDGEEVDHLDVVTCWKGISFSHASEIVYWEGCLKSSLEKIILDVISQLFLEYARLENGRDGTPYANVYLMLR